MAATASYNKQEIDQAGSALGAQAGKFGSVGDDVPQNVNAGMFGTASGSAAVAQAASALCAALRTEFAAAERLLQQVERTLDATTQSYGDTEQGNKQSFQTQAV